jgi:hypothetical protein
MKQKIAVDHRGLQAIVRERGEVTLLDELVQNALDTDATEVTVEITSPSNNRVRVVVTDNDPVGVPNLDDLNTLFAPSLKRGDPSKRGFMNVGEKLAVAYAVNGEIISTSGSRIVTVDEVKVGRKRTKVGTVVDLTFPLSKAVMAKMLDRAHRYLIGDSVKFTVNGEVVPSAAPTKTTKTTLGRYVEKDGDMRISQLVTQLDLYELEGRLPTVYVLGIPVEVVEDLPYSVDVRGRLKADMKRDQIPATELHRIKVAVADLIAEELTHQDVTGWARETMADASDAVVQRIVTETYGPNPMVPSVTDHQANLRAVEEGRTLIPSRAFSAAERERFRAVQVAVPTFAPVTSTEYGDTAKGLLTDAIPEAKWTKDASHVVDYARDLFAHLFPGKTLAVTIYGGKQGDCIAAMGRDGDTARLSLNQGDVGWGWFAPSNTRAVVGTLIHEFAHFEADGHGHSYRWGCACADIGARAALWGKLP